MINKLVISNQKTRAEVWFSTCRVPENKIRSCIKNVIFFPAVGLVWGLIDATVGNDIFGDGKKR